MNAPFQEQDGPQGGTAEAVGIEADVVADAPAFHELASRAQSFIKEGNFASAREVFVKGLAALDDKPSYQRAVALERIGCCHLMEGQPLAAAGLLQQAAEMAEEIEPTDAAGSLQGVIQSELGQVFSALGYLSQAREAYEAAVTIARSLNDRAAVGIDLDRLATLALHEGHADEARSHLEEALSIFRECKLPGAQAVALHHLGVAAEMSQLWDDAEQHYADAARLLVDCRDYESAARLFMLAAGVCLKAGRPDASESWYREALQHSRLGINPVDLRRNLSQLARLLQMKPGSLSEARELIEEALEAGENSLEPDVWELYGQLADVIDLEAASTADAGASQGLGATAQTYRHIQRYGPRLLATLKDIGEEPSLGAAVILERLGRCCLMGGRPAPGVILFRQALAALDALPRADTSTGLRGIVQSAMGDAYRLAGFPAEARKSYQAALDCAEELEDLRGELVERSHLGAFALASGEPDAALEHFRRGAALARTLGERQILAGLEQQLRAVSKEAALPSAQPDDGTGQAVRDHDLSFSARLHEDVVTESAFDSDLLIDVRRETRIKAIADVPGSALPDDACPMIVPGTRVALDEDGALRFYIPQGEPDLVQDRDCIFMRKTRREISITGHLDPVWALIRLIDGTRSVAAILDGMPPTERASIAELLSVLVACRALDVSGRPTARFIHVATKKGVLSGGGLENEGVLGLATDGAYRAYPGAERIVLSDAVPEPISAFHALTRSRRSRRDYTSEIISRTDFDALLLTACGLTGAMSWSDREVKLRSYPSSGALYAVEIYPVVLNVDALAPGVYHYVAADNALEAVKLDLDLDAFVQSCLPVERDMVSKAGAMICLVGAFRRHECKYGEGGYRMMVAEAGHISQNLLLGATALGLSARPFGGVFDTLVNRNLGLDEEEEQFLLSVLVGHAEREMT